MVRHRDHLSGHAPQVERQPGASAEAGDLVRVRIREKIRVRVRERVSQFGLGLRLGLGLGF